MNSKKNNIPSKGDSFNRIKILFYLFRSVLVYIGTYCLLFLLLGQTSLAHAGGGMYLVAVSMFFSAILLLFTFPKGETNLLFKNLKTPGWYLFINVFLISVGLTILLNRLFTLIPWEVFEGEHVVQDSETLFSIPLIARILIYGLIAPISEELLFRGAIYARLRKIMPPIAGVIISSLAFGIYHLNWMQGFYAFIMGSVMAICFECFDCFAAAVIFHSVSNLLVVFAQYNPRLDVFFSSVPAMVLSAVMILIGIMMLVYQNKKWNKCSK